MWSFIVRTHIPSVSLFSKWNQLYVWGQLELWFELTNQTKITTELQTGIMFYLSQDQMFYLAIAVMAHFTVYMCVRSAPIHTLWSELLVCCRGKALLHCSNSIVLELVWLQVGSECQKAEITFGLYWLLMWNVCVVMNVCPLLTKPLWGLALAWMHQNAAAVWEKLN